MIDSWDSGEYAYVKCTNPVSNTTTMLTWKQEVYNFQSGSPFQVQYLPFYNYGGWALLSTYVISDCVFTPIIQGYHTGTTLRVYVGSTLDSYVSDESFGVGSVEIWVK